MPDDLVCIDDFEHHAKTVLPKIVWKYYSSGASAQISLEESKQAFKRLRLRPRVLRDVSDINMSTTILGDKIDFPVCISPTAVQKLAHPDGEIATAKAACRVGTCMVLSMWATSTIEEVAQSSPQGLKWFHVYVMRNEKSTISRIHRAEKEGYKALVITVDAPYRGLSQSNSVQYQGHHLQYLPHLKLANAEPSDVENIKNSTPEDDVFGNQRMTWNVIQWLRSVSKLPIILKGILTVEDAKLAVKHGVDGIIVSSHGGRQLDTVPATIEVLPKIAAAVNGQCEVYLDGGIRHGTDIFKALALGARAVFVGRPVLWGLAYQGEEGVYKVLQILKEEFKLTMGLMGCSNLSEILQEMVVHQSYFSRL